MVTNVEERVSRLEGVTEQIYERLREDRAEHTRLEDKIDAVHQSINEMHHLINGLHQLIIKSLLGGLFVAAGVIVTTLIRPLF